MASLFCLLFKGSVELNFRAFKTDRNQMSNFNLKAPEIKKRKVIWMFVPRGSAFFCYLGVSFLKGAHFLKGGTVFESGPVL